MGGHHAGTVSLPARPRRFHEWWCQLGAQRGAGDDGQLPANSARPRRLGGLQAPGRRAWPRPACRWRRTLQPAMNRITCTKPLCSAPRMSNFRKLSWGQAGRGREDALESVVAQRHRQHGDDDDADQGGATNAQGVQRGDDEETQDGEQRAAPSGPPCGTLWLTSKLMMPALDSATIARNSSDARCDGAAQGMRNAFDEPQCDARYRQYQEDHARDEHGAQRPSQV